MGEGLQGLADQVQENLGELLSADQTPPDEGLPDDAGQGVDVRPLVEIFVSNLFRRHVRGRADHHAGLGHTRVETGRQRDSEIEELGLKPVRAGHQEDVVGLDVPVDDVRLVCGRQGRARLPEEPGHLARRPWPELGQETGQATPSEQLHDQEGGSVLELAAVEEGGDSRVLDPGDQLRFPGQAEAHRRVTQELGFDDLESDISLERLVVPREDGPHPALADEPLETVSPVDPEGEDARRVEHRSVLGARSRFDRVVRSGCVRKAASAQGT